MNHKSIVRPTTETIITFHEELINKIGGSHGIRDENLLDMSVNAPFQTFGGNDLYPTLIDKAAHLVFSLIKNHPFLDGNKRIGVTAMIAFLKSNDMNFTCTNEELAEFGLGLADGSYNEHYAQEWIRCHILI
ncbi:MAG: type II toxin-antitoxin system death-on-curing family toxin [Treponema sp.]|nr:type II toxin-antitoxin system death-on-curing family toxin [Treponema sp.]